MFKTRGHHTAACEVVDVHHYVAEVSRSAEKHRGAPVTRVGRIALQFYSIFGSYRDVGYARLVGVTPVKREFVDSCRIASLLALGDKETETACLNRLDTTAETVGGIISACKYVVPAAVGIVLHFEAAGNHVETFAAGIQETPAQNGNRLVEAVFNPAVCRCAAPLGRRVTVGSKLACLVSIDVSRHCYPVGNEEMSEIFAIGSAELLIVVVVAQLHGGTGVVVLVVAHCGSKDAQIRVVRKLYFDGIFRQRYHILINIQHVVGNIAF